MGNLPVGPDDSAALRIDLPAGGNRDALHRTSLLRQEPLRRPDRRIQDRRPVSVEGYALRRLRSDAAFPVHQADVDLRAAQVYRQNHPITAINRCAISRGRVMAPPTTTAQAPSSSIFFACSGVCTRPSAITGQGSFSTI